MRIKEVHVTVSRTFNLGNYESLKIEGSATADLQEGDDIASARATLLAEVRESLTQQYREFKPKEKQ